MTSPSGSTRSRVRKLLGGFLDLGVVYLLGYVGYVASQGAVQLAPYLPNLVIASFSLVGIRLFISDVWNV